MARSAFGDGNFSRRMKRHGKNVIKNADQLVRRCALATDAAVVLATPVDTGRARANWQVECNTPATGTTAATSKSGRESIDAGKTKIAQYKGGTPNAAIYITNNLPYIGRLNEGHSAQAPAGFVEQAAMVGVRAVHSAGGLVSKQVSKNEDR
jgi:hypothetical protein